MFVYCIIYSEPNILQYYFVIFVTSSSLGCRVLHAFITNRFMTNIDGKLHATVKFPDETSDLCTIIVYICYSPYHALQPFETHVCTYAIIKIRVWYGSLFKAKDVLCIKDQTVILWTNSCIVVINKPTGYKDQMVMFYSDVVIWFY